MQRHVRGEVSLDPVWQSATDTRSHNSPSCKFVVVRPSTELNLNVIGRAGVTESVQRLVRRQYTCKVCLSLCSF